MDNYADADRRREPHVHAAWDRAVHTQAAREALRRSKAKAHSGDDQGDP